MEYEKSRTISIREDTWKKLWENKIDLDLRTHDQVIQLALGVLDIIKVIAKAYNLDVLTTASDMAKYYERYLRERLKNEERRGL